MQVGERARVLRLERPTEQDRDRYVEQEGLLVRRLNTPWTADLGSLWQIRFDDGTEAVFSQSELAHITDEGSFEPNDMDVLRESWGEAPRTVSIPFRRFGAGVGTAPALLAFLVFSLAGVLLVWAGVQSGNVALGAIGGALLFLAVAAVAVLVA